MGKKGFSRKQIVRNAMSRSKSEDGGDDAASVGLSAGTVRLEQEPVTTLQVPNSCPADAGQSVDRSAAFKLEEKADLSVLSSPLAQLDVDNVETNEDAPGKESKSHLIQRHKRELKALKEQMKKLGKKNKDEASRMEKELLKRQEDELQSWEIANAKAQTSGPHAAEPNSIHQKRPTRTQKRRIQRAAEDAQREERIAVEDAERGESQREIEEQKVVERLNAKGLMVHQVQADGHCMYRAVAHQLLPESYDFLRLRTMAADFMRENPVEFLPYLTEEDEDVPEKGKDAAGDVDAQQSVEESDVAQCTARLMRYCARVKDTVLWGGEMELRALSCALKRSIEVFSSEMDALEIGPEFAGTRPPLQICYFRHAYSLGEHYNSVVPLERTNEVD